MIGISRLIIVNSVCANADTEYSQALPGYCSYFLIKTRAGEDLKFSLRVGESNTSFILLPGGTSFSYEGSSFVGIKTIYFQSPTAGAVVEIVATVV